MYTRNEIKNYNKEQGNGQSKNTNFMGVITNSNMSWEVHTERTCNIIIHNLFIINRLSNILDVNERRMLYCGLTYPFMSYGIAI
jgi:hypothetical protein